MQEKSDVRVTIRVDRELKQRAETLFERLGLNMSTALNIFLRKAVGEEAIPFAVSAAKQSGPLPEFSADKITSAVRTAVQNEIAEKKRRGLPIARYDAGKKQAYIEFADGEREYVHG